MAGRCVLPGTVVDDAPMAVDAPIDAPPLPIDAPPDAPNLSGCSDGEREALIDLAMYPSIAGCSATWNGTADLRGAREAGACGDDLGTCEAPVDACAPGWHVCGASGQPTELSNRVTEVDCANAGDDGVKFVAALSHCSSYAGGTCAYDVPLPCLATLECSEPVCCGTGCRTDLGCAAGVYPATRAAGSLTDGCAALLSSSVTGVLCCQ